MIIFDEEKYALDIINNGFKNKSIFKDVAVVAKYLRYKNDNDKYVKENIYALCKEYKKDYNEIKDSKIMDKIIDSSKKWNIKLAKNIKVTLDEFEIIKKEDVNVQKILFVLLVISKFHYIKDSKEYYANISDVDLFKLCKINITKTKRNDLMHYITQKNYILPTINFSLKLNYIKDDSDLLCEIPVDDNIITYLDKLLGKKTIDCDNCGKLTLKTSNRTKYCKECSKLIYIEKSKESVKRQRKSNV